MPLTTITGAGLIARTGGSEWNSRADIDVSIGPVPPPQITWPTNGLLHRYTMDGNGLDSVGSANLIENGNVIYSGTQDPSSGANLALQIIANNIYLSGNLSDVWNSDFTYGIWIRIVEPPTAVGGALSNINNIGVLVQPSPPILAVGFRQPGNNSNIPITPIDWGNWIHTTFTFNSTTKIGTAYHNSVLFDSKDFTGWDPNTIDETFGWNFQSVNGNGFIGVSNWYNRILSQSEITWLYTGVGP